jgi:NADPH:quinone reductase-like Zn-dependent oxidoreductase
MLTEARTRAFKYRPKLKWKGIMPRVVRFHQTGAAEVLRIEDLPFREPGENEVRLKVEAIGLNRAEVMFRNGMYLETPIFPARLGQEAAGVVDAIGPGVTGIKEGDRVSTVPSFAMSSHGVYGESAVVPAHAIARYPARLTPVEGASIWTQYLTVWGAFIRTGAIRSGQTILITAASSSVGLAAIEVANFVGAVPIAVTRGSEKKKALLELGAAYAIASADEDLPGMVSKYTNGNGADLIFDPVAGRLLETLAACAASGAQIIEYGWLSGEPTPFPLFPAFQKALTIRGYTLYEFVNDRVLRPKAESFVYELLEQQKLKPKLDRTFALDQIVEAHRYLESNRQVGKIAISVA